MFLGGIALGLVLGWTRGGRLKNLSRHRLRWLLAPVVCAAAQIAASLPALRGHAAGRAAIMIGTDVVMGVWLVGNATALPRRSALALWAVAIGWLLNLAAIAPNAGMPVSRAAMRAADLDPADIPRGGIEKHVVAGPGTTLRWLGDIVPIPHYGVVSVGDIVVFAGVAVYLVVAMGRRDRPTRAAVSAQA